MKRHDRRWRWQDLQTIVAGYVSSIAYLRAVFCRGARIDFQRRDVGVVTDQHAGRGQVTQVLRSWPSELALRSTPNKSPLWSIRRQIDSPGPFAMFVPQSRIENSTVYRRKADTLAVQRFRVFFAASTARSWPTSWSSQFQRSVDLQGPPRAKPLNSILPQPWGQFFP
jgi:hypothetical protein